MSALQARSNWERVRVEDEGVAMRRGNQLYRFEATKSYTTNHQQLAHTSCKLEYLKTRPWPKPSPSPSFPDIMAVGKVRLRATHHKL